MKATLKIFNGKKWMNAVWLQDVKLLEGYCEGTVVMVFQQSPIL
jgi:hypothetical protein